LLAVAAAALVLSAVARRSAGARIGAGHGSIVSMTNSAADTDKCAVYGSSNVQIYSTTDNKTFKPNSTGWIWLAKSDTIHVQGLVEKVDEEEKPGVFVLTEITVGGPSLQGGAVYFETDAITYWPPSGAEQKILEKDMSVPGILNVSVLSLPVLWERPGIAEEPVRTVVAGVGGLGVEARVQTVDLAGKTFIDLFFYKPVESSETGVCVNAEVLPVSESDNIFLHHSPAPTGTHIANTNDPGIKSGTANTFLHVASFLGCANSIVPFVL